MSAMQIGATANRLATIAFLLLVLSLGWMKNPVMVRGLAAYPFDLLFAVTCGLWVTAVVSGSRSVRLHRAFWLLLVYFAALAVSLIGSHDIGKSAFKLVTQAYLLFLPVLTYNLLRSEAEVKRAFASWIAAAGFVGAIGTFAMLAFLLFGPTATFDWAYHNFGTLPAGPYRRLGITFEFPAMLANYLGVALMLLLASRASGWIGAGLAAVLAIAIGISTFFTLTPGIGGVAFMLGAWFSYRWARDRPKLAGAALAAACAMPVLAMLAASVSPTTPASSPFLIEIPGVPALAPSVRLLAWTQAVGKIGTSPLVGHGIGIDPVDVDYEAAGCGPHCVTDAHNTYLSIAAQCGLVGLAALLALIGFVTIILLRSARRRSDVAVAVSIAWLGSFAMQGLVGSFEDQRHLWILFGLILCVTDLSSGSRRKTSAG